VAAVAWRGKGKREQRLGKVCENRWDGGLCLFFCKGRGQPVWEKKRDKGGGRGWSWLRRKI